MKMRNKKTGEIMRAYPVLRSCEDGTDTLYPNIYSLNEEWEDCKPIEPLIKDEKIRKVVRAWVDNLRPYMCDGVITFYVDTTYCTFQVDVWGDHNTRDIAELDLVFDYNGLEDNTTYTTDELCGGEKE